MKVNKHIFFSAKEAPDLLAFLQQNDVSFQQINSSLIVFDIDAADSRWNSIAEISSKRGICAQSDTTFSNDELQAASWLRIRSIWHNGYPLPDSNFGYREICYDTQRYCRHCGSGLTGQISPFRLKSSPKWGTRHFMTLNWLDEELFVDDTTMNVLLNSNLTGFHFLPAVNKQNTQVLPGVHQLYIEQNSNPGLIASHPQIDNVCTCPVCGISKYHPSGIGMHSFSKEALENMPDICRTNEIFGWGCGADRFILIRQRMYRYIVDNHFERGLVFEPINIV